MVEGIILLAAITLFLTVVCVVLGILLNRDGNQEGSENTAEFASEKPWWNIQLVELRSGKRMGKAFQRRLILGRKVSAQEPLRLLFVGERQTISRSQCEILERKNSLVVHNLSGVNMTWHNGMPLYETHQLNRGDYLDMGGDRYVLEQMDRVG